MSERAGPSDLLPLGSSSITILTEYIYTEPRVHGFTAVYPVLRILCRLPFLPSLSLLTNPPGKGLVTVTEHGVSFLMAVTHFPLAMLRTP